MPLTTAPISHGGRVTLARLVLVLAWVLAADLPAWPAWGALPASRTRSSTSSCLRTASVPRAARHPASAQSSPAELSASPAYDHALRLREALEGRAEPQRSRGEYERVIDAFRAVYHGNARNPHADASVAAVAELLAEEGRLFKDRKASLDAIGEYEFLRRAYPASRRRESALLTEGAIYGRDLNDRADARAAFSSFLRLYPRSLLAEEARQELKSMPPPPPPSATGSRSTAQGHPGPGSHHNVVLDAALASQARAGSTGAGAQRRSVVTAAPAPGALRATASPARGSVPQPPSTVGPAPHTNSGDTLVEHDLPSSPSSSEARQETGGTGQEPPRDTPVSQAALNATPPLPKRGRLPLVTGVRHWSTSVYTRVAIDLQDEVQYQASRAPNPDRIFFDLHGATLSPELIGKAVTVTDGGYLKRIRAAQFSGDVVRVVLDVSNVSEYSAFFLPNPARLIIDIHGSAQGGGPPALIANAGRTAPSASPSRTTPANSAGAPGAVPRGAGAGRQSAGLPRDGGSAISAGDPARSAPLSRPRDRSGTASAESSKGQSDPLNDIATLDRQPNTVRATRQPTTAPVSVSVANTTPAPQVGSAPAPASNTVGRRVRSTASGNTSSSVDLPPADAGAPPIHAADVHPPASRPANRVSGGKLPQNPSLDVQAPVVRAASPTATGERSMVRALGLKIGRIVVDAGHGGHDSGTLGPGGIEEKDVVLDVALRLGKLLKQRLGADVIYTRDDDTFIPLETRTAIANKAQADLFISVHANSSPDATARGVETYYLNFTSSADALEVAARENAVSDQSIHQLSDLVKKITLQDKLAESREFAGDVEQSLYAGLEAGNAGLKDRGVKKAPFVVLIGANMPSILAEISFLTNPDDAHQLRDPEYRERIAESLYRGVSRYVGSLSGVRLAQGGSRPSGN